MPAVSKIAIKNQIFDALVQLPDFDLTKEQLEDFLSRSNFQMNKTSKKSNPDRKTSAYHCFLSENKEGTIQERRTQWKILNEESSLNSTKNFEPDFTRNCSRVYRAPSSPIGSVSFHSLAIYSGGKFLGFRLGYLLISSIKTFNSVVFLLKLISFRLFV